ncbi:hypothetical protein DICPUDRAFT_97239 [Dictyostelium purpureum]|uniref:Immunity protein Imm33 domain-containing protein n=1 Tax=Dictyostelium purpureum TaxID=5786 RepID=F0ZF02_DICPU|nr:uncharacterized protein DICPUDRAFT_97239 [Dictyostelium purpureum]EGC37493.1 hypothetical protein DICPUDRAFT_97239 [Dictyostelium purpureum]|eukprot:XP_003285967.1 hypothetical protein DICPUDRAFT_97239 [Dictyostelium purpureum]
MNSLNLNGGHPGYSIDNVVLRGNDFKYTFSLPSKEQILNLKQGDLVKLIFSENNQAERMWVEVTDIYTSDEIFHSEATGGNSTNFHDSDFDEGSSGESSTHKDEKNKLVNSQSSNKSNGSPTNSTNGGLDSSINLNNRTSNINKSGGLSSSNLINTNLNNNNTFIKFEGVLDNNPYQLKSLKLGDKVEFFDYNILCIYNQNNQYNHPDLETVPLAIKQMFDQLCLVSNRILVDKENIGYIFREKPTFTNDSGWRIFEGDEPDDYMNKRENYQLVTIASVLNIDDSILLLLGASFDRHFELDSDSQWKELVEK